MSGQRQFGAVHIARWNSRMPLSDDHAAERIQAGNTATSKAHGFLRMGHAIPPPPGGAISITSSAISQMAAK
jgi:hypothetical protein